MNGLRIGKYITVVVGLAILLGAWISYQSTRDFLDTAQSTSGEVVDFFESRTSESITYRPVVSFQTERGQSIQFTSPSGSSSPAYSRGETVEVLYDPSAPRFAQINSVFSLWGVPVIFTGIGSLLTVFGIVVFFRQRTP